MEIEIVQDAYKRKTGKIQIKINYSKLTKIIQKLTNKCKNCVKYQLKQRIMCVIITEI